MRGEVIEQRLLIFREPEEVVLLADPVGRGRQVQRTLAVDEVLLLLERLAADAVPAFVDAFVDVAGLAASAATRSLHARAVTRLGRPDEIVERHVEHASTTSRNTCSIRSQYASGSSPRSTARPEHVLRVLVVAHQETGLDAAAAAGSAR